MFIIAYWGMSIWAALKSLSCKSNICAISVFVFLDDLFHSGWDFLNFGTVVNFGLHCRYFKYYVLSLWFLFKFSISAGSQQIQVLNTPSDYFMGCGSNVNLIIRDFSVLLWPALFVAIQRLIWNLSGIMYCSSVLKSFVV